MSQVHSFGQEKASFYEERLICFIDLLGFKDAINVSKKDTQVFAALYEALDELKGERLVSLLHGSVPVITENGEWSSARAAEAVCIAREHWPLVATQFSDSFVISCPAENSGSCLLLLKSIDWLQNIFFSHLGMLMRGGVSKGQLIHEQGGPLFGPAMNSAYTLESVGAIYPRILFEYEAAEHIGNALGSSPSPIFTTFDGHQALDLISCLALKNKQKPQSWDAFNEQLSKIEQDILDNCATALPKVRYLRDRLNQHWQSGQS
ncbi:hypothetical protein [Geopseudomonas aromaticivorans]